VDKDLKNQLEQPLVHDKDAFFEAIAAQSAEGVTVANKDGQYIYVNPAFCEMIGYSVDELLQMTVYDVKSENQDQTSFSRTKSSKEGLPVQVYLRRKDGSEFFSEVLGKVIQLGDETIILGIIRDITDYLTHDDERLILERRMQHAQKLESLGVLAGGIAHDFNNILMVILGNADLALTELSPMSSVRSNLIEIEKASRRAAELSKQMLAYSGKGQFIVDKIIVDELVQDMVHLLEVSTSKKVTLTYNFADNVPTFGGDVTQIRQVIMNLITNASEAVGDNQGVVSLSTGTMNCNRNYLDNTETVIHSATDKPLKTGTYAYIEVSDTGCGMDSETIERMFDPFFTTKFTGRGLGMSAVQGIMRGHNGAINVDSTVGKGTTFRILFYIAEQQNFADSKEGESSSSEKFESNKFSGTVLLVEYLGFHVLTACDGQDALQVFTENKDDINYIFLDLMMPKMDGKQAFLEIQKINDNNTPVLLCSGYSEINAIESLVESGLAGFLQKPFTIQALKESLNNLSNLD